MFHAEVVVFRPDFRTFTYRTDDPSSLHRRFRIPFGRGWTEGIVVELHKPRPLPFPVKSLGEPLDPLPVITPAHLASLREFSWEFLLPLGEVLPLALPPPGYPLPHSPEVSSLLPPERTLFLGFRLPLLLREVRREIERGRNVKLLFPDQALLQRVTGELEREGFSPLIPGGTPKEVLSFWEGFSRESPTVTAGILYPSFLPERGPTTLFLVDQGAGKFLLDKPLPVDLTAAALFMAEKRSLSLRVFSLAPSIALYKEWLEKGWEIRRSERPAVGKRLITDPKKRTLTKELTSLLEERLPERRILLLLNRVASSPLLYCPQCRRPLLCERDGTPLQQEEERVSCPQCQDSLPLPEGCPRCGTPLLSLRGKGIAALKHKLSSLFPDQRAEEYSRKSVGRGKREEEVLESFQRGEFPLLLGTDLAVRPFHLQNLSLIILFYPEFDLSSPDPAASERLFSLLTSLAWMKAESAPLVIKTDFPDLPLFSEFLADDFEGFFSRELELRKKMGYFPFRRFLTLQGEETPGGIRKLKALAEKIKPHEGDPWELLGPFLPSGKKGLFPRFTLVTTSPEALWKAIHERVLPSTPPGFRFTVDRA